MKRVKVTKKNIEEAMKFLEIFCMDKRTLLEAKSHFHTALICMDICRESFDDDDEIIANIDDSQNREKGENIK